MMVDRFSSLIIPRSTVELIGKHEIGNLMVGFTWRQDVWQQPRKLIQVGLIQIIGAGIIFAAMMLPIDRGLNTYRSSQSQSARSTQLILVDSTITIVILVGINSWIFHRGKRLRRFLKLVAQIEQYNQIIESIITLQQVAILTNHQPESNQTNSTIGILSQTRQNLLIGLEIDRYLDQYPNSDQLAVSIAHNLIDLQSLAHQPQLAEYGMLLSQAWEIGMSVYTEVTCPVDKSTPTINNGGKLLTED
jgi:hypothetical protein